MDYRKTSWNAGYVDAEGRELPLCCIMLIGVNVIIFLLGILWPVLGSWLEKQGQFSIVYLLYDGEFYRLVTSAFLHMDAEHLMNNMLLLYFCGEVVEKTLGKCRFLVLYFVTGICGNLLSAAYEVSIGGYYDSVGASGAVFGLTGALLFLVITRKGAAAQFSMKRVLISIVLSLYAGFSSRGVNNAAHIGGLLSGFLLAFLLTVIPPLSIRKDE